MQNLTSPLRKPRFPASALLTQVQETEEYKSEIKTVSSEEASKEQNEREMRIMDFLEEKGVEFKSPSEKMHDYWDKQRKRRFSETEIEDNSTKEFSFSRGLGLNLNSKLYCKRVKTHGKSCFQSP